MDEIMIHLSDLMKDQVRNLSGHNRGLSARSHFGLDQLDSQPEVVVISVPETADSISTSFLQGMFGESIRMFKNRDAFIGKYKFDTDEFILGQVDRAIRRVLSEKSNDGLVS